MSASVIKQLAAALICAQTFVILGAAIGSGSVLFAQETASLAHHDADTAGRLSVTQVTWIVSSFTFGNIPGTLASIWLSPRVGAPRLLLAMLPLALVGSAMIGLGPSFAWTLAGRLLVGLYFGVVEGPARAYVGEVTGRTVRGVIGNILNTVTPVCIVVVLGLGARLPWRTVEFALESCAAVVQACGLLFLPRSPKWLLAHGHSHEEAEEALRFFHGADFDIKQAVRDIEGSLALGHQPSAGVLTGLSLVFRRRESLHPTLLLLLQFFCMVFSGGLGVAQFAPTIFQLTGQDVNPFYSSVYVTAAMSLAFLLSGPLLERCNRLLLLQIAGLLGMAGCGAIGAYFWQEPGGQHAWLVLAGALVTVLSYGAGIAPVTFTFLVELLPNSTRAITINMVLLYFSLVQFCAIHFFPAMEEGLGNYGTFWLFAAVNLLQVLLASSVLPETRGLSLEEIQHKFFAARRRSSAGSGAPRGSERIVDEGGDAERGEVNPAVNADQLEHEERTAGRPEVLDQRRRSSGSVLDQRRGSSGSVLDQRRRSSGSVLSGLDPSEYAIYPAGCFV